MQQADRPEFVRILAGLATIKPGGNLTPEALDLWWAAMQRWAIADFRAAASHLASTVEFMPSPFHFEQLRKASRPTAAEAWLKARAAIRWGLYGHTIAPDCDPVVARALQAIGGASAIAMCDERKLYFIERQFAEVYEELQHALDARQALPELGGPRSPALFLKSAQIKDPQVIDFTQ